MAFKVGDKVRFTAATVVQALLTPVGERSMYNREAVEYGGSAQVGIVQRVGEEAFSIEWPGEPRWLLYGNEFVEQLFELAES